jgi:hypothetical protein
MSYDEVNDRITNSTLPSLTAADRSLLLNPVNLEFILNPNNSLLYHLVSYFIGLQMRYLLYGEMLSGRITIKDNDYRDSGYEKLAYELYQAMCKLGRLYIENGQTDQAASVHQVLHLARFPLKHEQWNLAIFQQPEFSHRDVILIDSQMCVPTADCGEIARHYGGFGENNLIEHRLYEQLCQATEKLGTRRQHLAYTAIRELLGRFSLIGEHQLIVYLEAHDLTPLQRAILDFFTSIPDIWLIKNLAHR